MTSIQERRRQADYDKLCRLAADSGGTLRLVAAIGTPPTRYEIEYHCHSLGLDDDGAPVPRAVHRVELLLGVDYPLTPPTARMVTPVFNPHVFDSQAICLGSHWTPAESLDALVLRIGALLQFDPRVLDFDSLANEEAGDWAAAHRDDLPLDAVTFRALAAPRPHIVWH